MTHKDLCYHVVGDRPDDPSKPMKGYFDLGGGKILPCGLSEDQRTQAVVDSIHRTRGHFSAGTLPVLPAADAAPPTHSAPSSSGDWRGR